jgi:hypothetical protein
MTDQLRQSIVSVLGIALCCCSLACRQSASDAAGGTAQPQSAGDAAAGTAQPAKEGMQKALTSFHAVITSPKTDLQLRPGQDTKVPVKVQNPGTETWISAGAFPVNVSYKWYKGGMIMGIEGERTALPGPVAPNQTVDVDVRVIAPPDAGKYTLRITLVQEAVTWFMTKGDSFLELPVTVR